MPRPSIRVADGRLHSSTGPAVEWPTVEAYWYWRDIEVPREWIEAPGAVDPRRILAERNLELRRALIEIIGWDRIVRAAGARLIDQGARGALLEIDLPAIGEFSPDLIARFVRVRCPSTGREYTLRVPPTVRTANEAVAWTFGIDPADYHPDEEA